MQAATDASMHTGVALLARVKELEKERDHPKYKESSLKGEERIRAIGSSSWRRRMLPFERPSRRVETDIGKHTSMRGGQGKMGAFRY